MTALLDRVHQLATEARTGLPALARTSSAERDRLLHGIVHQLRIHSDEIWSANLKDLARAEEMYRAGCETDSPRACKALADLLKKTGKGTPSQIAQLRQRAFDAAKLQAPGNPFYRWILGTFHLEGVATLADARAAAELFVQACEGYDPVGCLAAGRLYLEGGKDLPPNRALAAVPKDADLRVLDFLASADADAAIPVEPPAQAARAAKRAARNAGTSSGDRRTRGATSSSR